MLRFVGRRSLLVLCLFALWAAVGADIVRAQLFSYGGDRPRSIQSVSFTYNVVDFNFDGATALDETFEYAGPAYGVMYVRPNLTASITYGPEADDPSGDLRLLDAAITTWGEITVTGAQQTARLFVPIVLQSNYRRVAPEGSENSIIDAFNVTVIGLGTGLGGSVDAGESVRFEVRATPIIGLALRAFGDSSGSSYLFDSDARIHLLDLVGPVGLSVGYGFRAQVWNVGASDLLMDTTDDLYDYSGSQHVLTVGLNW